MVKRNTKPIERRIEEIDFARVFSLPSEIFFMKDKSTKSSKVGVERFIENSLNDVSGGKKYGLEGLVRFVDEESEAVSFIRNNVGKKIPEKISLESRYSLLNYLKYFFASLPYLRRDDIKRMPETVKILDETKNLPHKSNTQELLFLYLSNGGNTSRTREISELTATIGCEHRKRNLTKPLTDKKLYSKNKGFSSFKNMLDKILDINPRTFEEYHNIEKTIRNLEHNLNQFLFRKRRDKIDAPNIDFAFDAVRKITEDYFDGKRMVDIEGIVSKYLNSKNYDEGSINKLISDFSNFEELTNNERNKALEMIIMGCDVGGNPSDIIEIVSRDLKDNKLIGKYKNGISLLDKLNKRAKRLVGLYPNSDDVEEIFEERPREIVIDPIKILNGIRENQIGIRNDDVEDKRILEFNSKFYDIVQTYYGNMKNRRNRLDTYDIFRIMWKTYKEVLNNKTEHLSRIGTILSIMLNNRNYEKEVEGRDAVDYFSEVMSKFNRVNESNLKTVSEIILEAFKGRNLEEIIEIVTREIPKNPSLLRDCNHIIEMVGAANRKQGVMVHKVNVDEALEKIFQETSLYGRDETSSRNGIRSLINARIHGACGTVLFNYSLSEDMFSVKKYSIESIIKNIGESSIREAYNDTSSTDINSFIDTVKRQIQAMKKFGEEDICSLDNTILSLFKSRNNPPRYRIVWEGIYEEIENINESQKIILAGKNSKYASLFLKRLSMDTLSSLKVKTLFKQYVEKSKKLLEGIKGEDDVEERYKDWFDGLITLDIDNIEHQLKSGSLENRIVDTACHLNDEIEFLRAFSSLLGRKSHAIFQTNNVENSLGFPNTISRRIILPEFINLFDNKEDNKAVYKMISSLQAIFTRNDFYDYESDPEQEKLNRFFNEEFENPRYSKRIWNLLNYARAKNYIKEDYEGLNREINETITKIRDKVELPEREYFHEDVVLESLERNILIGAIQSHVYNKIDDEKDISLEAAGVGKIRIEKMNDNGIFNVNDLREAISRDRIRFFSYGSRKFIEKKLREYEIKPQENTVSSKTVKIDNFLNKKIKPLIKNPERWNNEDVKKLTKRIYELIDKEYSITKEEKDKIVITNQYSGDITAKGEFPYKDNEIYYYDEFLGTHKTRVIIKGTSAAPNDTVLRIRNEHSRGIERMKNTLGLLKPQRVKTIKRTYEGEIDEDAYFDMLLDMKAGQPVEGDIFKQRRIHERDIEVLLTINQAKELGKWVDDNHRVMDYVRPTVIYLSEATKALEDKIAILGYTSKGANHVAINVFKRFEEEYDDDIDLKLGLMSAQYRSRTGAAYRHFANLMGRSSAKRKIHFDIITKLADDEAYTGENAIRDVIEGVKEEKSKGVEIFAVSVDPDVDENKMREIYGAGHFKIIRNLNRLPDAIVDVYRVMTLS